MGKQETILPEVAQFGLDVQRSRHTRGALPRGEFKTGFFDYLGQAGIDRARFIGAIHNRERGIGEMRTSLGVPRLIKLGDLVAFAETVLTDKDQETRNSYTEIFETGLMQKQLKKKLRIDNQVDSREMRYTIENQSPDLYRSVVEITSNAIDFSEDGQAVTVDFTDTGYTVRDFGKGMDPVDIFEKLLIPTISGARDREASIGKFGVGFMTALNHLNHDGDTVSVKTSYEGRGYEVKFHYQDNEIYAQLGRQDEVVQGTEVTVDSAAFDTFAAKDLLTKHLHKKRKAPLLVDGQLLNSFDRDLVLEVDTDTLGNSAVICTPSEQSPEDANECTAQIMINGVMVEEFAVEGIGLPSYLALDLPYNTSLPESRNAVEYDSVAYGAVSKLVDTVISTNLPDEHKTQITNALAPVINTLQSRQYSLNGKKNLLQVLDNGIVQPLRESGRNPVPNEAKFTDLAIPDAVYVSDMLPSVDILSAPGIERCHEFVSDDHLAYLLDFTDTAKTPVIIKFVLLNQSLV